MRLDFLMLADGASAADGKVYVHGGAITRVTPPTLPSPPIVIAIVARLLVDEEDRGRPPAEIAIEWTRPDGEQLLSLGGEIAVEVTEEPWPDEEKGTIIVANAIVSFEAPGPYDVSFRLDGDVVGTRRLVVQEPAQQEGEAE